jgi:dUTPase
MLWVAQNYRKTVVATLGWYIPKSLVVHVAVRSYRPNRKIDSRLSYLPVLGITASLCADLLALKPRRLLEVVQNYRKTVVATLGWYIPKSLVVHVVVRSYRPNRKIDSRLSYLPVLDITASLCADLLALKPRRLLEVVQNYRKTVVATLG